MITLLLLAVLTYIAGSLNFSIVVLNVLKRSDPRMTHSQNPGVTNVYRQEGLLIAAIVFLLDMARSMGIAVLARYAVSLEYIPWIGVILIMGNRFPCFHHFQGGKGVANYLGFTAVVSPLGAGISAVSWCAVYLIWRLPFVASFAMILVLAAATAAVCGIHPIPFTGALAALIFIVYNHKQNIRDAWLPKRKPR